MIAKPFYRYKYLCFEEFLNYDLKESISIPSSRWKLPIQNTVNNSNNNNMKLKVRISIHRGTHLVKSTPKAFWVLCIHFCQANGKTKQAWRGNILDRILAKCSSSFPMVSSTIISIERVKQNIYDFFNEEKIFFDFLSQAHGQHCPLHFQARFILIVITLYTPNICFRNSMWSWICKLCH